MEAWTNSSTGADEPHPEGAPSPDPAEDQVTPPPQPLTLEASNVATPPPAPLDASNVVTPPPEKAVPTALPTMISGEIQSAVPAVTVIPAPAAPPAPSVVIAAHARPQPHAGDDPGFSDQIINNWMRQGDRLSDPRAVEDLALSDLAEPTDPVAHELLDSQNQSDRPALGSGRIGRWVSVGALGVAMSFGLYWAAQEPRRDGGFAAAPLPAAIIVEPAPAPQPPAPAPAPVAPEPAPDLAAIQVPQPAASTAHGKHKHRKAAATAVASAGRSHHHHGR